MAAVAGFLAGALPALVHFSLLFTAHHKAARAWYVLALLYLPALFISFWDLIPGIFVTVPVHKYWGWEYIARPGPLKLFGSVWVFCLTALPAVLAWMHYRKRTGRQKRQVFLVALGFSIAAASALSTGYLFMIINVPFPSLTVTAFIIGSLFIDYAIIRYELFALTPERALTEIVDNMSDLLFLVNPDGEIAVANKAAQNTTGYGASEMKGKEISRLLTAVKSRETASQLVMQSSRDARMDLLTRDERTVPVSVSISPVGESTGTGGGSVYLVRDITERERMQEALQLSEQNFRTSLDESPLGISIIRADSVNLYGNNALLEMFQYRDRQDYLSRQPSEFYMPDSYTQYLDRRARRLRGETVTPHFEVDFTRRDGELRHIEVFQKEVLWDGEKRFMLLHVDVTEKRRAENALRESEERYRHLSEELQRQNDQKTHFLHQVAHELKTPLTAIISSSELVTADDIVNVPLERRKELLDNINRSAWMMNTKVSELLDLARIQTGQVELTLRPLDIADVVRDMASQLSALFGNKRQSVILDIPSSLPPVKADRKRTEEVIVNLLSNANKYTAAGGHIRISACIRGATVRVEVSDTAPAIDRKERERIFEPYYRGGSSQEQQRMPGLGLGLAISRSLVELQKGEIGVESAEGHGNTFYFTLPLWTEEVKA